MNRSWLCPVRMRSAARVAQHLVALRCGRRARPRRRNRRPRARSASACCSHRGDGRQEFQVLRARHARRVVVGRAGEADAHAAEVDDGAVLEARQRPPVGAAQVGGIERKLRLRHALEEHRLAEIELVVAGRENVGRDHVGQRDDMRAAGRCRTSATATACRRHARRSRWPPLARSALTTAASRAKPPRALAVGHQRSPIGRCRWSG